MFSLVVQVGFCGAHFLKDYEGPCSRMHGHNYRVEVRLSGNQLDASGMLVDFKQVKAMIEEIVAPFDHRVTNEVPPFDRINPTAENMCRYIHEQLAPRMAPQGISVDTVGIWETEKYGAFYTPGR